LTALTWTPKFKIKTSGVGGERKKKKNQVKQERKKDPLKQEGKKKPKTQNKLMLLLSAASRKDTYRRIRGEDEEREENWE